MKKFRMVAICLVAALLLAAFVVPVSLSHGWDVSTITYGGPDIGGCEFDVDC